MAYVWNKKANKSFCYKKRIEYSRKKGIVYNGVLKD